jgi:DNA-binding LacI/PurR family transcriptional regulator
VDGSAGAAAAVEHLANRGHQNIGFIGWPPGSGSGDDRLDGWRRAMRTRGLSTRGMALRGLDGISSGTVLAGVLLASSNPPTAIVCVSDTMAVGPSAK